MGILLEGEEDEQIIDFFVSNALPPPALIEDVLEEIAVAVQGLSSRVLGGKINVTPTQIQKAIHFLELEDPSPIIKVDTQYRRTAVPYAYPTARAEALAKRRRAERAVVGEYVSQRVCLMQFLSLRLGDDDALPCGRCSVCTGSRVIEIADIADLTALAEDFVSHREIILPQRKQWPEGGLPIYGYASNGRIPVDYRTEEGRALAYWRRGVIGRRLRVEKYSEGRFSEVTVSEAAMRIREWSPEPSPQWICGMVSSRHPQLVPDFARRLAAALGIRWVEPLRKTRETEEQKDMQNASFRARNLDGSLEVDAFDDMAQPGILVDDMYDSGWTVAIVGALLRGAGSGSIFPFTLAKAADKE